MVEVPNWGLKSANFLDLRVWYLLTSLEQFSRECVLQSCLLLVVALLKSGHGSPVMYDQDASTICSHLARPCSDGEGGIAEGSEGCFPYTTLLHSVKLQ